MWPPYTAPDEETYTFDHLKNLNVLISVTIKKKIYKIPAIIIFSNHCFTDGKDNTVQTDDPLYILTDDTGHRAFCLERYKTSLTLPDRMRAALGPNPGCYRLSKASHYIHIHDSDPRNKWSGWYIFFKFDRNKEDEPLALRISITSYHRRMTHPQNLRWKGSYKFAALVADWFSTREDYLASFPPVEEGGREE